MSLIVVLLLLVQGRLLPPAQGRIKGAVAGLRLAP
jgi:hypothetical protein